MQLQHTVHARRFLVPRSLRVDIDDRSRIVIPFHGLLLLEGHASDRRQPPSKQALPVKRDLAMPPISSPPQSDTRRDQGLIWPERVQLFISLALRLILAGEMVAALVLRDAQTAFLLVGILALTFLPAFIRRNLRVYLPVEIELLIVLLVFASLFMGSLEAYYTRFWWWDKMLHTWAGLLTGAVGFLLVFILNREERPRLSLSPAFVGLFAFAFAMTVGVIWEIFEFALDSLFGMRMQQGEGVWEAGLTDTMWDLIVNALGGLVTAWAGYYYVRSDREHAIDRLVRHLARHRTGAPLTDSSAALDRQQPEEVPSSSLSDDTAA